MNIFSGILFFLVAVKGFAFQQTQRCKLPVGVTDFEKIRQKHFCYIDKTDFISKMFQTDLVFFFIARPRKFGKSLFCRTIESALWGNKQLFEGLAIHDSYDWIPHPVIYLDFSSFGTGSETSNYYASAIVSELQKIPGQILRKHRGEIKNPDVRIHADSFNETDVQGSPKNLVLSIEEAFSSTVGIVIDEYDSAITKNLKKPEICDAICLILRDFYACVKGLETQLRFVFITGVARFT